eukprot:1712520-Pyramimonas_sp.AAC.1
MGYITIVQSLDLLDTLHYSIRGPASGNTSLPDMDSSRFAGCTSGLRSARALGAFWKMLIVSMGIDFMRFCRLETAPGRLRAR